MSILLYRNPILDRVYEWSQKSPSRVCMKETSGRELRYQELISRVDNVACDLIAHGLKKNDKVFFLARPNILSVIYFLAVLRAGGVLVVADIAMGREAFRSRFELADPSFLILEPALFWIQKIPFLENILRTFGLPIPDTGRNHHAITIRVGRSTSLVQSDRIDEMDVSLDDDAVIVFTSGTTALPKGVVHTFRSISATLDLIEKELAPLTTDIFYASQINMLLIALLTGATAIVPSQKKFSAKNFIEDIEKYSITKAFALPAECEEIISHYSQFGGHLPESLVSLMLGSAPVLSPFLSRLERIISPQTKALCIYGSTEILPIAGITMSEKLAYEGKGDILGIPFKNVHVWIEDNEIVVSGPNLCRGYIGGSLLAEYKTGDLGTIDEKGRVVLLGRKKDMIIKGNHNIYPALFETAISGIKGVRQCALVGIYNEDKSDEEIILAIEKDSEETDEILRVRIKKELGSGPNSIDHYAQPDRIVFLSLPVHGRSRKVDKNLLRSQIKKI